MKKRLTIPEKALRQADLIRMLKKSGAVSLAQATDAIETLALRMEREGLESAAKCIRAVGTRLV